MKITLVSHFEDSHELLPTQHGVPRRGDIVIVPLKDGRKAEYKVEDVRWDYTKDTIFLNGARTL
jgi:hypothetical protein